MVTPLKVLSSLDRYQAGWTGDCNIDSTKAFPVLPVSEVLTTKYSFDAHFAPYYVEGKDFCPRVKKDALPYLQENNLRILFDICAIDVDDPIAHRNKAEASAKWRIQQTRAIKRLPENDKMAVYHTRGGLRIILGLPHTMEIDEYLFFTHAFCDYLSENGVSPPDKLPWGQLFRCPYVVRDGKTQQRPAYGLSSVGRVSWYPDEKTAHRRKGRASQRGDSSRPFAGIAGGGIPTVAQTLPDGSRTNAYMSMAGRLRYAGCEASEILHALLAMDKERGNPPLQDTKDGMNKLIGIADHAARYDKGPPIDRIDPSIARNRRSEERPEFKHGSELEFADYVTSVLRNEEKIIACQGDLWRYNPKSGIWEKVPEKEKVKEVLRLDGANVLRQTEKGVKETPIKMSNALSDNVLKLVYKSGLDPEFFDDAPNGIAFGNGFVTIVNGSPVLQKKSPNNRCRHVLDFDYIENANPKVFIQWLRSVFEGPDVAHKVRTFREFLGLALIGKISPFETAIILFGRGSNGKSTLIAVIEPLFPKGSITALTPQDFDNEYRVAMLADSRMNMLNELPIRDVASSDALKSIISGQPVTGRPIREAPFTFRPQCGHLFAANGLPMFRDFSHGFLRKLIVIPMNKRFTRKNTQVDYHNVLLLEKAAIASWAIQGASDALRRGHLLEPLSSREIKDRWRKSNDQTQQFLEERCEIEDHRMTLLSDVYSTYTFWSKRSGHKPLSKSNFLNRLELLGIVPQIKNGKQVVPIQVTE